MVEHERLAFMASWLDNVSGVSWTYQLMMYPSSSEVELFDVKNRRVFLRRTKLEGLKPELFFVGGCCTVLGRQLNIIDYGDEYTRKALSAAKQRYDALTPGSECGSWSAASREQCLLFHTKNTLDDFQDSGHRQARCCFSHWRHHSVDREGRIPHQVSP